MKIEFDGEQNTVTVNGVPISMEVLQTMTQPETTFFYRFERRGDMVMVRQWTLDALLLEFAPVRAAEVGGQRCSSSRAGRAVIPVEGVVS